jgi:hypothetical protein
MIAIERRGAMAEHREDERTLGELFAELSRETGVLIRKEVELARAEMSQKVARAARDMAWIAVGALLVYGGVLVLLAAAVTGLAGPAISWGLASLIVAVAVIVLGYVLAQKGMAALRRTDMSPRQTIESLKENAEWAKQQTR